MYPYLLVIVADGLRFTTRHKTYGEALVMKLELEAQYGKMFCITLSFRRQPEVIKW
ncbi:hypothetical protein [Spirosoma validum]|uniref:Uncharacterized protein n=1 Tax=Spirosoma validum TaxID=2771355 RepID=A0A927B7K1_9BACT|nr:hypothetical protein [Spirosoma validum]MBD2757189.1 hypothetical protein [Spirosoma validum]